MTSFATLLTRDTIYRVLSDWTGMPVNHFRADGNLADHLEALPDALNTAILGQQEAVGDVVHVLRRRLTLPPESRGDRPVAVQLFVGPSGVGKTELARQIATIFYGGPEKLTQLNMSEFSERHTVARLVGAPPGYVGYDQPGQLVRELKRQRYGVLLLDEIEKAHPSILNEVFLPLLGEGVVHDMSTGQCVDARDFLIVLTSNLGTNEHLTGAGMSATGGNGTTERSVLRTVRAQLPHEIQGRIDRIIVFRQLTKETAAKLWNRHVESFEARAEERGWSVHLAVDGDAKSFLFERACIRLPEEGARAIQKAFERSIEAPALELLAQDPPQHSHTLRVSLLSSSQLRFALVPAAKEPTQRTPTCTEPAMAPSDGPSPREP